MNQLLLTPRARATDPDTSHAAAASVNRVSETHQAIYTLILHHGPITDEALLPLLHKTFSLVSPSGARSRRAELVKMGRVRNTGNTAILESGRQATLWAAVV